MRPLSHGSFSASPYMDCVMELDDLDHKVDPILSPISTEMSGRAIEDICFEISFGR